MRKKLSTAALLTAFLSICLLQISSVAWAIAPGEGAPDFNLTGNGSESVSLSKYRGKVVYLDFWASWCGPCRQSFPWMNAMHDKYASKGLVVLAINLDGNQTDAQKFLQENPARFTLGFDPKAQTPKLFGVKGMPTSYLVDRHGRVIDVHVGFNVNKKDELELKLIKLLEGR